MPRPIIVAYAPDTTARPPPLPSSASELLSLLVAGVQRIAHAAQPQGVNSLHMHMIDTRYKGPTYARLKYKDLALDDVLSVLRDERRLYSRDFTEPSNRGIARQPSQRRSSADGSVQALDAARAKTDGAASPRTDGATTPRRSSFWGFGK